MASLTEGDSTSKRQRPVPGTAVEAFAEWVLGAEMAHRFSVHLVMSRSGGPSSLRENREFRTQSRTDG
jgi:hypothetical protein